MKNWKQYLIYVLLPIQILVLMLCPRFGWKIRDGFDSLAYEQTSYSGSGIEVTYANDQEAFQVSYSNPFSREFVITVNEEDQYYMAVNMDGGEKNPNPENVNLPGYIGTAVVWNDPAGIFFGRYIVSIALTVCCIAAFTYGKKYAAGVSCKLLYGCAAITYFISMLISFRVIW